jgi:threonylcarbamoyladenosine tRNA methylthiotransferase MtaB
MTRVFLHTFGCKANQYDSEVLRQALEAAGATIVTSAAEADAAVVNSCTVTHVGEGKMRGLVRRLARAQPDIRTVVVGCAAALDNGTLAALPNVADVIGGAEPAAVLRSLELPTVVTSAGLRTFEGGARAWLKIQDGCDEHCTFCATKLARGRNRSRHVDALVAEARVLAARHAEIVLTGVHIGSYGADLDAAYSLGTLVETLVERVADVRFRLSSVEVTELEDRLARLMTDAPDRLAPHLHAPLQSGSDRILKRMGRHWYTAAEYRRRLETLADRVAPLGLGADIMVGFPGESREDFVATRSVVEDIPFTYLHVFPYSVRPNVAAARLGPAVPPEVAKERSAELRRLAQAKGAAFRTARAGGSADIVTLTRSKGRYEGLTGDYVTVDWPAEQPAPARFRARLAMQADGSMNVEREERAA